MKFLLALALLSSFAIANDAKEAKHEAKHEVVAEVKNEEVKLDKKAAYKATKEACLKENKDLKGKKLKECIVSKNK